MDTQQPLLTPPAKEFPRAEEGIHPQALIKNVEDRGMVETSWGPRRKLRFTIELSDQFDDEGNGVLVFHQVNFVTGKKAALTELLVGVLGGDPGAGYDLRQLIGKRVDVTVKNVTLPDGREFSNITSFSRPRTARQAATQPAAASAPLATPAPAAAAPVTDKAQAVVDAIRNGDAPKDSSIPF